MIIIVKIFVPNGHYLYVPGLGREFYGYPPISLTGSYCALQCKHCRAKILKRMIPAKTPQELVRVVGELYRHGVRGILISGGSNRWGQVPFEGFVDAIKYVKRLGLRIYIHTGLVDEYRAQLLKEAGVDVALIDFTVNDRVIEDVLNLKASPKDFIDSIKNLVKFSVRVAPHIVIGIYHGEASGEKQAIDVLRDLNPNAVVLVVFTPLSGTSFENYSPPPPSYIFDVMRYAKSSLPNVPLSYGCMKPHNNVYQLLEIEALHLGFEGISFPSYSTVEYLINRGIDFEIIQECCTYIAV